MDINWVKRENASDLVLNVMTWSMMTVLSTRWFLSIFGWPTISFGDWHIAHVLWGGIFMLIAMLMVISSYGQKITRMSTVIFGIGWGLFVDEIGKYLTKDNDYWFQPAIIFIYISFILLFLIYRYLDKSEPKTQKTVLYSILSQLESVAEEQIGKKQKRKLLYRIDKLLLLKDHTNHKFLVDLREFVQKTKTSNKNDLSIWAQIFKYTTQFSYDKIFKKKWALAALGIYSGVYAVDKILELYRIINTPDRMELIRNFYYTYDFFSRTDTYMIALKLFFDVVVSILYIFGLITIAKNKKIKKGLIFFQYGLLIVIFLSSIIRFYFEQFGGVMELAISIIIYNGVLRLRKEKIT